MPKYTVSGLTWKRTTAQKQVRIAWDDHENQQTKKYYSRHHPTEYLDESFSGTVEVTIDIDDIVKILAGKAVHNSTGMAGTMQGRIKAKVVKKQVLSSVTRANPVPKGYSVFEEKPEPEPELAGK